MAVDYASKYDSAVQERFKLASVTENAVNKDFDFTGVNTVNVYSVGTVAMNDYVSTGTSRYGSPDELGNEKQTMVLAKDRSFAFTIDKRNYSDTMMTMEAGKALARQIDEVVTPEVDIYRLGKIVAGAGTSATPVAITKDNAYVSFLDGKTVLLENKVPLPGTFAYISTNFYKAIRQDDAFIKPSDMAQEMLVKGQVGMIEGIPLIYVPSIYLPVNTEFVLTNKIAATSPTKLAEYKTHIDPPGINGWLIEGRLYYDCFVLDKKAKAIYVHKSI